MANRLTSFRLRGLQAVLALGYAVLSSPAEAQRSLPFGEDAQVLGFGQLRVGVRAEWQFYDQVYSGDGGLVPFGAALSYPSIGTAQFPQLGPYEGAIRAASGQTSFQFSLGTSAVHGTHRTGTTALQLQVGLPGRLMISAEAPFVRSENAMGFGVNTDLNDANVGVNPALTTVAAFVADTIIGNQIGRARNTLSGRILSCPGSSSSQCTAINANPSAAQALVSRATSVSNGILLLSRAPYVPLSSSTAQAAITAQIAAIAAAFRDYSINTVTGSTVSPATVPITAGQFRQLLESSNPGPGASVPSYRSLTRLGDVNVGAKFKIIETPYLRAAAFGKMHFPTGGKPSSAELFPLAAGDGAARTEFGGMADYFAASGISITAAGAMSTWFASDVNTRIVSIPDVVVLQTDNPSVGAAVLGKRASRTGYTFSVTPRYAVNRWLTLGAQYMTRHIGAEEFSDADSGVILVWNQQPASTENRMGGGLSFSNLSSSAERGPRFPIEASFFHSQSISGSGLQPKIFSDEIRVRIFLRK